MSTPQTTESDSSQPAPLLGLRAALIFTLAVLVGVGAGVLTVMSGGHPAQAVLVGGGGAACAAAFFNWAIARR